MTDRDSAGGRVSDCPIPRGPEWPQPVRLTADKTVLRRLVEEHGVNRETDELRELLSTFLDALVLPGHVVTPAQWDRACLLCGRWCHPWRDKEDLR
jgi:hypothetical protein